MPYCQVTLQAGSVVREFESIRAACLFLGVEQREIRRAIDREEMLLGWAVTEKPRRKSKEKERPIPYGRKIDPPPRVKNIYLRKPYADYLERKKEK